MNKIIKIVAAFLGVVILFSCSPDEYTLGDIDVKPDQLAEGTAFKIEYDKDNPNTIHLTSLIDDRYTPLWEHPQGRSQAKTVTLQIPFPGTYEVKFGVLTRGGAVFAEPTTFAIDQIDESFISDPLWTYLSGGLNNEKSWVLDTEAKKFKGPLYFYGLNNGWLLSGGSWSGGETGCYGNDCWVWDADIASVYNGIMASGDYGVMTFNLNGGPFFHAIKPKEGNIEENGTYFLDVNSKMLTINNGSILRGYKPDKNGITGISDWKNYIIFSLTEDTMQLGVIRDKDVDNEGKAMLVYNFIVKE